MQSYLYYIAAVVKKMQQECIANVSQKLLQKKKLCCIHNNYTSLKEVLKNFLAFIFDKYSYNKSQP
jgi:hypothetical protein